MQVNSSIAMDIKLIIDEIMDGIGLAQQSNPNLSILLTDIIEIETTTTDGSLVKFKLEIAEFDEEEETSKKGKNGN